MNVEKIRQLASIPLKSIDVSTHLPKALGCGCFVQYKENSLFLTVQHLYTRKDMKNGQIYWVDNQEEHLCIEVDFSIHDGTMVKPLGEMHFLNKYTKEELEKEVPKLSTSGLVDKTRVIDIAFKQMEFISCKKKQLDNNLNVINEKDRIWLNYDINTLPSSELEYGFSGYVMPNLISPEQMPRLSKWGLPCIDIYHSGLKYIGEEGLFLKFSLPYEKHPGHQYFEGTSGAPIIDSNGKLISLVSRGDATDNVLFGINLRKIMPFIEMELNI